MSTEQQRVGNIPYDRNPYFTGREQELRFLHDGFLANRSSSPISQALVGESGIGKTQIALEYAHRYRDEYQAVFWIHAGSHELLATECVSIADQLKLPAWIGDDQEPIVDAVREGFAAQPGRWLLILDHLTAVADLSILYAFLPESGSGDILITGDLQQIPDTIRVAVGPMEEESGAFFLLLRSLEIVHGEPLQSAKPATINMARKVVVQLGGHPLALELAAALLEATQGDLSAYLEHYQALSPHLPVETTWSLFWSHVEQHPVAVDLLRFCAFLTENIPLEIFFTPECPLALHETIDSWCMFILAHPKTREEESTSCLSSLMAHDAIDFLSTYFLMHRERTNNMFSLHPLVQSLLQGMQDEHTQRKWAERVVVAVSRLFPKEEFEVWETCQRYLPQALVCADLITRFHIDCPEAGFLLNETGAYLSARAQYTAAHPFLEQALSIRERILGTDHPETAQTLSDLGHLARRQGRHTEAKQFYQRALDIREHVLEGDREIITSLNDLGEEAQRLGETSLAGTLYQRARTLGEQVLGLADSATIRSQGNLAIITELLGDDEKAESAYKEALLLSENALGPSHLGTALALSRLASFYEKQGMSDQAKSLLERSVAITDQKLGASHPEAVALHTHLSTLHALRREGEGNTQDILPSPERSMKVNIAPPERAVAQIYGIQLEPIDGVYSQMVLPAEAIIEKPLSHIRLWEDCVWYPIFLPGAREAGHYFGFLYDPFASSEGHWLLMHFDHENTQ